MSRRFALLCSGQGCQSAAMFQLALTEPQVGATPAQWIAQAQLGHSLDALLADESLLFANRYAQPLIVAATLAVFEALRPALPPAALVAGYSIGELSAYAVAQSLAPADAVRLAAARARAMDACIAPHEPHALLAISDLAPAALEPILAANGYRVAILTGPANCVAGGLRAQAAVVEEQCRRAGARVQMLRVDIASHTPRMDAAVAPFRAALEHANLADPATPVLAGIGGQPIRRCDDAIAALSAQLAQTLRWSDCMDALAEAGIGHALELGPGKALSTMLRARHPQIEARSVAEFRSLAGVRQWLERVQLS